METESVNKPEKLASHFQGIQNPMEPEFMIIPNPPLISSDTNSLSQDYYYRSLAVSDDGRFTRVDLDPLYSNAAYRDASELLKILFRHRAPMPDIGWLMDGGIGLEWRVTAGRGIATMSLYGDKNVVYGATVGNTYRVKNTCRLSSLPSLASFLKMLTNVFSQ